MTTEMRKLQKKSVLGPVISVFVTLLVVAVFSGLSFLFVAYLKTNTLDVSESATFTVINESGSITTSGYLLDNYDQIGFKNPVITYADNETSSKAIVAANYTISSEGMVLNATPIQWSAVRFSYTYQAIDTDARNAYISVNKTETAGATVVNYLSLMFLALIFGAILTLVLKIILPYINMGQNIGGF